MSEYNATSLVQIVQSDFAESQENAGRLILNTVIEPNGLSINVDGKMITNLMHGAAVHGDIRDAATKADTVAKAKKHIEDNLIKGRSEMAVSGLCSDILKSMQDDISVPDIICEDLQAIYTGKKYAEFLAQAIPFGLSRDNSAKSIGNKDESIYLVEEAGFKCPLCGDLLCKKVKNRYVYKYRIVQIYPSSLDDEIKAEFDAIKPAPRRLDSVENKIALSEDCAESYLAEPTADEYARLLEKKDDILRAYKAKQLRVSSGLTDKIAEVIEAIAGISKTTELKPFTGALTLEEKIYPEESVLQNSIENDVVRYYPFIEKQFSLLDGVSGNSFNVIRSEVTAYYEKLEGEGRSQREICSELATWMIEKNGFNESYRLACNIVVAFFVQNCSVFKPIAEAAKEVSQ